jgi:Reverse transcriptase (RNA-dependent DNA polymerase)
MVVPRTYKEAMKKPEAWRPSIDREMAKMWEHGVWTLVEAPADANIVDSKWHYALKFNSNGDFVDHKSCLVAKGFTQVHGTDYFQTFASVVHFDSLHLLLVLALHLDLELWQIDFESAFLNGRMKEDVYMCE